MLRIEDNNLMFFYRAGVAGRGFGGEQLCAVAGSVALEGSRFVKWQFYELAAGGSRERSRVRPV
jgi:hypothetical protein